MKPTNKAPSPPTTESAKTTFKKNEGKKHTVGIKDSYCSMCGKETKLICTVCQTLFCSKDCSTAGWQMHENCIQIPKLSRRPKKDPNVELKSVENISASEERLSPILHPQIKSVSSLRLNEPNEVIVTFIENETDLFVTLGEEANNITLQIASIQNKDTLPSLLNIKASNLAFVNRDGFWYRVKILNIGAKKRSVTVEFIDFGYTNTIAAGLLKILPEPLEQVQPLAIKVRLANGTVKRESINTGDTIYLNVVGDKNEIPLVTVEDVTKLLEEDLSQVQLLAKWHLDATLAEKFDELSKLRLTSFHQLREHGTNSNKTSDDQASTSDERKQSTVSKGNEENLCIEEMWEKITSIRKQIKIAEGVLISMGKDAVIKEAYFSNLLDYSLHSLGLAHVNIEYQHIMNMLIASTYGQKFTGVGIDNRCLRDFRTILNWKLNKQTDEDSTPLNSETSRELNSFISFFNESLSCPDHEVIHTASAVMLNFLTIAPFQPDTNEKIARLLFCLILREKNFPMIIFPMDQDDKLKNVSCKATDTAEYTEYLKFTYECCIRSLDSYLDPLRKGIRTK